MSTNYYSDEGAAYIDSKSGKVKTIFSKKDYDPNTKKMMEALE